MDDSKDVAMDTNAVSALMSERLLRTINDLGLSEPEVEQLRAITLATSESLSDFYKHRNIEKSELVGLLVAIVAMRAYVAGRNTGNE